MVLLVLNLCGSLEEANCQLNCKVNNLLRVRCLHWFLGLIARFSRELQIKTINEEGEYG